MEVIEVSQDRDGWDADGVGEGPRDGNRSLNAERRGLDFDFFGVESFVLGSRPTIMSLVRHLHIFQVCLEVERYG